MTSEPLHIVLVRHGQTDANRDGIVQGHTPTELNALGRQQARLLAERLATFQPAIELIVSSDLPRAAQTAEPIAEALGGVAVRIDSAWREKCYGIFEGTTLPQRTALRQELGLDEHADPPGAQSVPEYQAAIRAALCKLPKIDPAVRCICVVTHGGACKAITTMLADGRLPAAPGIEVPTTYCPNCSLTHLIRTMTATGPQYRYGCLYDVEHLRSATVTAADVG